MLVIVYYPALCSQHCISDITVKDINQRNSNACIFIPKRQTNFGIGSIFKIPRFITCAHLIRWSKL